MLLPLVAAAVVQFTAPGGRAGRRARARHRGRRGAARVPRRQPVRDPRLGRVRRTALTHQSDASGDAAGKLGLTQDNGYLYYLWSFGWGLGWIPLFFAARRRRAAVVRRAAAVLGARPGGRSLFVLFMGSQERYFGRWLMPVFPFVCILAAYAAFELADWQRALLAGAEADGHRRRGRRALRAGLRVLAALGPRAVARGHAQPRPRLDGRERPARDEDRRRAGRARPVGAGHRQPVAARRATATAG